MADRLKDYLKEESFKPKDRIFPEGYEAVRAIVRRAGNAVGVKQRPHDLRATQLLMLPDPSSGEIASKVILRHIKLSTTQRLRARSPTRE